MRETFIDDLRLCEAGERDAARGIIFPHRVEEAFPRRRKRVLSQRREVRLPRRFPAKPFVLEHQRRRRVLVAALRGFDLQFFLCQSPHLFG